jgi:hypothetical protein
MKKDKTEDARGRPRWRSWLVGDPGAIFPGGERGTGAKQEEDPIYEETLYEVFLLLLSSLAEPVAAARSGQGRAVFWRGGAHP